MKNYSAKFCLYSCGVIPVTRRKNLQKKWAQYITYANPLRYFMEIMRMVYLKGSSITDIIPQLGTLTVFATVLNSWAIYSYKKQQ